MSDTRTIDKRLAAVDTAIARMLSARRAIVDVRLDRQLEDHLLGLTTEILDELEQHQTELDGGPRPPEEEKGNPEQS